MTLGQLSAAATQGAWKSILYDAGDRDYYDHNGPTPGIFCDEADCGIVHWDGFKQKYWSSANGNQSQIEANAAFIVALVNLYRTGQLVAVADDAIERVARALAPNLEGGREFDQMPKDRVQLRQWTAQGMCLINDATQDDATWLAGQAIAAMKDTQP